MLPCVTLLSLLWFATPTNAASFRSQHVSVLAGGHVNDDDSIKWPGAPADLELESYGGYIPVNEDESRQLYYVFVKAEIDEAPLVVWLNGGPGCSSLGGGLMSELGPFYPNKDGKTLQTNRYRWNAVANMVFLESPAGVGFSRCKEEDLKVGDERTAWDSVRFIVGFLERYPGMADRPLYISGESYGGHYVPNLAAALVAYNKEHPGEKPINIQGFFVGNAWTDASIDNHGAVDYWWSHAIISDKAARGIKSSCDFGTVGPLKDTENGADCSFYVANALTSMGRINIYDIYADVCVPARARGSITALQSALAGTPSGHLLSAGAAAQWPQSTVSSEEGKPAYDPCIDNEVARYLNRPKVQKAMHANVTGDVPGPWQDCSPLVAYSREDLLSSMIPVYRRLVKSGLKIWVFSGDVDAIVPVIGTRRWIRDLDLDVVEAWRPWYHDDQVGGYMEGYDGLTLATVRDAGHMVPYTQPGRARELFEMFLKAPGP